MREKLIRLQSLYIDQFKRLQHLLKEKKRRYLHNRKVEHEAQGKFFMLVPTSCLWVHNVNLVVVRFICSGTWSEGEFAFENSYLMARIYPVYFMLIWSSHPSLVARHITS